MSDRRRGDGQRRWSRWTIARPDGSRVPSPGAWVAIIAVPLAVVVILAMVLSDGGSESAAPPVTQSPVPTAVQDAVATTVRQFFDAYNAGSFVEALRFVSRDATQGCGTVVDHANAYRRLRDVERLAYEVRGVTVHPSAPGRVSVDITWQERDIDTRAPFGGPLATGHPMVRDLDRWVFESDPLLGAPAFCP